MSSIRRTDKEHKSLARLEKGPDVTRSLAHTLIELTHLREAKTSLIQTSYAMSLIGPWRRFRQQIRNPERSSQVACKRILQNNATTAFGQEHGFDRIQSISDFQSRVPVRGYDELAPYINRAAEGRSAILTSDDVIMFEKTSGAAGFAKLIPYTRTFLREMETATAAWLGDLHFRWPELLGTKSYWAASPHVRRGDPVTIGGIPIGMDSDVDYFNPLTRAMMRRFVVRPKIRGFSDIELSAEHHEDHLEDRLDDLLYEWRLATAAALLEHRDLGLISIWSPTFMFPIIETMQTSWDHVITRVSGRKRRLELDQIRDQVDPIANPQRFFEAVWPRLRVLSAWSDGPSAEAAIKLESLMPPNLEIEGKGLIATEGVVTIPFSGAPDPVIAVGSHFIEFIDLERPSARPRLPHELKTGGLYSPLLTTSGGLYRYHLRDVLFCSGRNSKTPTLRFHGRLDKTSDICGERIDAAKVDRAFEIASNLTGFRPDFLLLTPDLEGPSRYRVFVESTKPPHELARFIDGFEKVLKQNSAYSAACESGALQPIVITQIDRAMPVWEAFLLRQGLRLGDLKLSRLDSRYNWREVFSSVTKREIARSNQAASRVDDAAAPVAP